MFPYTSGERGGKLSITLCFKNQINSWDSLYRQFHTRVVVFIDIYYTFTVGFKIRIFVCQCYFISLLVSYRHLEFYLQKANFVGHSVRRFVRHNDWGSFLGPSG